MKDPVATVDRPAPRGPLGPRRPHFTDGLLFDRRARRLVEKASRCIAQGGKIPGQVSRQLPRAVLERIASHYGMKIDAAGACSLKNPSASAGETAV